MCASAARVRYTSFLSFQYTRYTPCATAIYLDRLMRSENLLLASQYHNYFISGSLIIRLFTAALRLRLFLPTFSPATRFSSLSFESLRVSKAFFIFASLPLEPRVSLDSLHFVNNATFVRPETNAVANGSSFSGLFYRSSIDQSLASTESDSRPMDKTSDE